MHEKYTDQFNIYRCFSFSIIAKYYIQVLNTTDKAVIYIILKARHSIHWLCVIAIIYCATLNLKRQEFVIDMEGIKDMGTKILQTMIIRIVRLTLMEGNANCDAITVISNMRNTVSACDLLKCRITRASK